MSVEERSRQDKQSPYVGYFRGNGIRNHRRLFEPNSLPHVGVYRHSPAKTTSKGLQEILRDKITSLKPKSVISTLQLFNVTPKHIAKKTLEMMPTSHYTSDRNHHEGTDGDVPICPICLENFVDGDEIRNLNCSHCFHKSCIDIWLLGTMSSEVTTTVCPTCRQDASSNVSELETGNVVYSSSDHSAPDSTIPAECFVRVGQFLLREGSKTITNSEGSPGQQSPESLSLLSPTASPPLPLPPIAESLSPPLPPLTNLTTPSPGAFLVNSGPSSNTSINSLISPTLTTPSPNPPTMFFPPLDDNVGSYGSNSNDALNELASHNDNIGVSDSFLAINISDVEDVDNERE